MLLVWLAGLAGLSPDAMGQLCRQEECLVDYKLWSTNRTKVGWDEYTQPPPMGLIRVFKTLQISDTFEHYYTAPGLSYSNELVMAESRQFDPANTQYLQGWNEEGCNNLVANWEYVACSGAYSWTANQQSCNTSRVAFPDCGWADPDCLAHFDDWPFGPLDFDYASETETVEDGGKRLRRVYTLLAEPYDCTYTCTEQLSDEYLTQELIDRIRADLDAQEDPGLWGVSGSAWTFLVPSEHCADGQKMVYRLRFHGETNTTYRIEWEEVTRYDSGALEIRTMIENVDGTGGETVSPEHVVYPPYQSAEVRVENVRLVRESDDLTENRPGTAHIGGVGGNGSGIGAGGGGGDCAQCGPGRIEGAGRGMALAISLGRGEQGRFAGWLGLWERKGGPGLWAPGALRCTATRPDVEVLRPEGWIRQVKAPQVLADVVQAADLLSFTVYLYRLSDVGPLSQGLYGTPDPTNALASWTVSRGGVPGTTVTVTVGERHGADLRVYTLAYDTTDGTWTVSYPEGLRQDVIALATTVEGNRCYTGSVYGPGDVLVYRIRQTYEHFDWGDGLVEEQIGWGTNLLTTTYRYGSWGFAAFDGKASGSVVPLEQVEYADGNWEKFTYDDQGRVLRHVRPFLSADPESDLSDCRYTEYTYDDTPGVWRPRLPRSERVVVLGALVQKRLHEISEFTQRTADCLDMEAESVETAGNLMTARRYYQEPLILRRQLQSVQFADGTREAWFYTNHNAFQTNIVLRGEADPGNLTNVLSGTQTLTVRGSFGELLERKVVDIGSGIVLEQSQYDYTDELLSSYQVTHLDQSVETFAYGCCGLEWSSDREGAETFYVYDSLGRRIESQRLGIRTTNQFDALGNTLRTVRIGTNGSSVLVLEQAAYDQAGRRTLHTNALGGVSWYTEGLDALTGEHTNRTVYPDGGIRLERHARDGRLVEVSGSAAPAARYLYGVDIPGELGPDGLPMYLPFTVQIRLGAQGSTNEWTRTYEDRFGRQYKSLYADGTPEDFEDNPVEQSWFNARGQQWKHRDPDGVVTLFAYNERGELEDTAIDLNANDAVDEGGVDRIRRTRRAVLTYSGYSAQATAMFIFPTNNNSAPIVLSTNYTSADGTKSWEVVYPAPGSSLTTFTQSTRGPNGARTVTVYAPDGAYVQTQYSYGRMLNVTRYDSGNQPVGSVTYAYDAHGRVASATDARTGATTFAYNAADQVVSVTGPDPGAGQPRPVTSTFCDNSGRITGTQLADGATTTNLYYPSGLLWRTWGARVYPVEYAYDSQGRLQTLSTWRDFGGQSGSATTRWIYDERGRLLAKEYPDPVTGAPLANSGPLYAYSDAGRLISRGWRRGVTTAYSYNAAGELANVDYSDGTPDLVYSYDRRGRRVRVEQGSGGSKITTDFVYTDTDAPLTEAHSGGTPAGLSMGWSYDSSLRVQTLSAKNGAATLQSATLAYDTAGRLASVSDGVRATTYAYLANSSLPAGLTFSASAQTRLATTRSYDKLNRLTSVVSTPSGASALAFAYQYNPADQRIRASVEDGSAWVYEYDALGQVMSGQRIWADGSPVAGQQFEYAFDDIGNRESTEGRASAVSSYTNNLLNQITSRSVAARVDVLGIANPTTNVMVRMVGGPTNIAARKGEYFHHALALTNIQAQYPTVEAKSLYGATQATNGEVYVAATPEVFTYDLDGNLTSDGRWAYTWDGENRLIEMKREAASPAGARQRLVFEYDYQGRRIRKQFYTYSGGWVEQRDTICLYEGWNVMAELDANASNARLRTYVWGNDLSGSRQGAGGVSGLLWVNNYQATFDGENLPSGVQFVACDGNGNVMALVKAADGIVSARYEYGPFGEPVRTSGALAKAQPFRFSSKWTDCESGLVYYGYRYYSTTTGRWLNTDPIGERGGKNLYGFLRNDGVNGIDSRGLFGLSYIDRPKWVPDSEYLWVGHYMTFDSSDIAGLSVRQIQNGAPRYEGTALLNHRTLASVTDCQTGVTLSDQSRDLHFANPFQLLGDGSLAWASYREPFTDGQDHMFFQIANTPMGRVFAQSPGYNRATSGTGSRTKGSFSSTIEVRIISRGAYDITADVLQPLPSGGWGDRIIDGHEMGGHYYGYTADMMPMSWTASPALTASVSVSFRWDNCCGKKSWAYQCSPAAEPGAQRSRYSGTSYPGAVDLHSQPGSDDW